MGWLQIVKMVLWGLLGIRSSAGSQADEQAFRPAHALGIAILAVGILLALLLAVVHMAVKG